MKHIILALDSRAIGGIETHVLVLAEALNHAGHRTTILRLRDHGDHPMDARARARGIALHVLSPEDRGLGRWLTTNGATLLHTHGYKAGILGRLTRPRHGLPIVSTFHNGDRGRGKLAAYTALDRITSRWSRNIAVSSDIARQLPGSATVIDNFVPLPGPGAAGGNAIGFVGRLSHEKGPDRFVELARAYSDRQFVMFGDGPMRARIEASAPANLKLVGNVPGMENHWADLDLLVMPSRQEGLPMAALEAMSHGVPVAAFGIGGLPDLIVSGTSGYLAAPDDMAELWALLRRHISSGAQDRLAMRQAARSTIRDHFSVEARLGDVLDVYQGAMQSAGGAR